MGNQYEDIMDLPHHQSDHRPHMSLHDRAAQFSPFAALTGHEEALREAQRLTQEYREPDENQKALLDSKLQLLQESPGERKEITVRYFVPDERKEGGAYVEKTGIFCRVDRTNRTLLLEEGERIPLDMVRDIQSELFGEME